MGTPFIQGTELIPRLRALGYRGKVLMKTANDSSADIARFKAAGADDAIAKGMPINSLGRELARVIGDTGGGDVIDRALLAEYSVPMRHLAVQGFREAAMDIVDAATAAAAAGDVAWGHIHRLKGIASYVGAAELVRACEAMRGMPLAKGSHFRERHPGTERVRTAVEEALVALAAVEDSNEEGGGSGNGEFPLFCWGGGTGGDVAVAAMSAHPAVMGDGKSGCDGTGAGAAATPSPGGTGSSGVGESSPPEKCLRAGCSPLRSALGWAASDRN